MEAVRRHDEVRPLSPERPGPAALVGSWVNTHEWVQSFSRLDLEVRGGRLAVRSWGPDAGAATEWGDAEAVYAGVSSTTILAFTARHDFGTYEGLLQGNLNLGLLVLGTYKTFPDGRLGYFSREFFAPAAPPGAKAPEPTPAIPPGALFGHVEHPSSVDVEAMVGRWSNADAATRGIAEIHVTRRHGGLGVRVLGTGSGGSADWGETAAGVYATLDETGVRTFSVLASYDLGFLVSQLQLRLPGGTLAVADFTRFQDDSGRWSYCTREFFFHHP